MNSKQIIGHIMISTGENVSALAHKHKYTKQAFYDAIKGRTISKPIRKIISDTIGKPISEIWTESPTEEKWA
jgi:hypothetical protein